MKPSNATLLPSADHVGFPVKLGMPTKAFELVPVALIDLISLPLLRYVSFVPVAFHAGSLTLEAGEAASRVTRPVPSARMTSIWPSEAKAILPLAPGKVPAEATVWPTAAVMKITTVIHACGLSFTKASYGCRLSQLLALPGLKSRPTRGASCEQSDRQSLVLVEPSSLFFLSSNTQNGKSYKRLFGVFSWPVDQSRNRRPQDRLIAEADENRTRPPGVARRTGFEDRGGHQSPFASSSAESRPLREGIQGSGVERCATVALRRGMLSPGSSGGVGRG